MLWLVKVIPSRATAGYRTAAVLAHPPVTACHEVAVAPLTEELVRPSG
ncbi:MAG: hypothetical protein OXM88_11585 [bacterium]|nr:hypothetical protein [bacterium]